MQIGKMETVILVKGNSVIIRQSSSCGFGNSVTIKNKGTVNKLKDIPLKRLNRLMRKRLVVRRRKVQSEAVSKKRVKGSKISPLKLRTIKSLSKRRVRGNAKEIGTTK